MTISWRAGKPSPKAWIIRRSAALELGFSSGEHGDGASGRRIDGAPSQEGDLYSRIGKRGGHAVPSLDLTDDLPYGDVRRLRLEAKFRWE